MAIIRKKKPLTLPEIRPNAGIARRYRKELLLLVSAMHVDIQDTLIKEFKAQSKREKMAMDGIADWIGHVIDLLQYRWAQRLDDLAPKIASDFVGRTVVNYETIMQRHLRSAGFTVRLQVTPFQREALSAVMENNVGLIKSISSQYLERVQVQVWQSVTQGYDLSTLSKNLQNDYGITRRRAETIARDQSDKANATIERAKRMELGITKAIWMHSHAGKVPRPSHLAANGKEFDVEKGMYLDGKWVQPAEEINCRCVSRSIIEGITL